MFLPKIKFWGNDLFHRAKIRKRQNRCFVTKKERQGKRRPRREFENENRLPQSHGFLSQATPQAASRRWGRSLEQNSSPGELWQKQRKGMNWAVKSVPLKVKALHLLSCWKTHLWIKTANYFLPLLSSSKGKSPTFNHRPSLKKLSSDPTRCWSCRWSLKLTAPVLLKGWPATVQQWRHLQNNVWKKWQVPRR